METQVLAVLGLIACLLVWIGAVRLRRFQAWVLARWRGLRGGGRASKRASKQATERANEQAQKQAADVIEKARRRANVERDGNVIRPKSFGGHKDDDTLH